MRKVENGRRREKNHPFVGSSEIKRLISLSLPLTSLPCYEIFCPIK